MKKNVIFIFTLCCFAFCFMACESQLDVAPDGSRMIKDKVEKVLKDNPDRLEADLAGVYSMMKAYPSTGYGGQRDFGYPSFAVALEHSGQDAVGEVTGYNWFSGYLDFTSHDPLYTTMTMWWVFFYNQIRATNDLIGKLDVNSDNPISKNYYAQSLAIRAFAYFNLAQIYQFTYKGHEEEPCVPIVTEETPLDKINNNPRATVKEVYDLIMKDLNTSIQKFEGIPLSTDKTRINQGVAYGLRARVNLVMNNWNAAEEDANKALDVTGQSTMSKEAVSVPTFDDVNAQGIMWGIVITEEDGSTKSGICNFTSMFTNLCLGYGGYTTIVGQHKKINVLLYDKISETDVRKGWWLDKNCRSKCLIGYEESGEAESTYLSWNDKEEYSSTIDSIWIYLGLPPYAGVKFAPNNKELANQLNATDFPLMRAAEMELIIAEAKAMGGDATGGASSLQNWVQSYRDPDYKVEATSPEEVQNAVWIQRRIEFWGEGLSWFDIMRLKKPLKRISDEGESNYGIGATFNCPAESPYFLFCIPNNEIQANDGISADQNNKMGALPKDQKATKQKSNFKIKRSKKNIFGLTYYKN